MNESTTTIRPGGRCPECGAELPVSAGPVQCPRCLLKAGLPTEPALTSAGAFLGTPSFSSPEQLRGDELTVRSDIYAVGVTLYYLLTQRQPFQAANLVRLLATVLEQPAVSPARWRGNLPRGLCRAVLRCLEKNPGDRFASYAELRAALQPYASAAPTPATLGLRFLAGGIDSVLLGVPQQFLALAFMGGWDGLGRSDLFQTPRLGLVMLCNFSLVVCYHTVLEGLWGLTAGKAAVRLRVLRTDRNLPGLWRACLRVLICHGLPLLPGGLLWFWGAVWKHPVVADWRLMPLSFAAWGVMALLFMTVRRRNGFAAVHDLVTGTRVVLRAAQPRRPGAPAEAPAVPPTDNLPQIGPDHILDRLGASGDAEMLVGFDTRLLRKVWIRRLPAGAPPLPAPLRNLGRPARLRWLTGQRSSDEAWDAYEALQGQPLIQLLPAKTGWEHARFWLADLLQELDAARDGAPPAALGLDRVWITADSRAKLLDFPAPGARPSPPAADAQAFLRQVALAAVEGRAADLETTPAPMLAGLLAPRRGVAAVPAAAGHREDADAAPRRELGHPAHGRAGGGAWGALLPPARPQRPGSAGRLRPRPAVALELHSGRVWVAAGNPDVLPRTTSMVAALLAAFPLCAANNALVSWNNLGMHCMDSDYSVFSILPPYNTIHAQLIVGG